MRRYHVYLVFICLGTAAIAAGRGDGGCVNKLEAPIFQSSKGDKIFAKAFPGNCFPGVTIHGLGMFPTEYVFEQVDGRVHISFLTGSGDQEKSVPRLGWMDPADLSTFTYECGCGTAKSMKEECSPYSFVGITSLGQRVFNSCFKEARDKKLAEMGGSVGQSASGSSGQKRAENALRNEDVLTLVKVGLEDKLIISKINAAAIVDFDLSTDGLVGLKSGSASTAVIEAMMKRAATR